MFSIRRSQFVFKLKRTIKMIDFLYKRKVRKLILLRTRYLNLLQDVRVIIIDNKIKTLYFQ